MIDIQFTDNSAKILEALHEACERGLEEIGQAAEKYAIVKTPVDTGNLRNSITHTVQDDAVFIGTNNNYAPYIEYGTGRYATNGNGRAGWWVYVAGSDKATVNPVKKIYTFEEARQIMAILRKKGLDAHMTQGTMPAHMLRDAGASHMAEYRQILLRALSEK